MTFILVGAVIAVPAISIAQFMIGQAVGRVTVVEDAGGKERTVYWRDYPGIAGLDSEEVLQGPTPEEGYETGQEMVGEIRAALTRELKLEWAPTPDGQNGIEPFVDRVQNYFGGESLLTVVNAPPAQSTSVPRAWADKERTIRIFGEITGRYGYGAPALDRFDEWTEEDRIRDLGGATPETQVIVSGSVHGPAGQWLMFTFQDLSKDTDGSFRERLEAPDGSDWQLDTISLSYGANGLLREANREEFEKRLVLFTGLTPPLPLET
ncbi:hypothetical protein [Arthrobacter sp. UYCu712]|uniref:hypothetical protein n=1 Tax=Arthrobacter sp. UYCu712 TaxID=3156340 RepID=UPI003395A201